MSLHPAAQNWMDVLRVVRKAAHEDSRDAGMYRRMWGFLRDARIYALEPEDFAMLYEHVAGRASSIYATKKGTDFSGIERMDREAASRIIADDDPFEVAVELSKITRSAPMPDRLPFDAVWFAYGAGWPHTTMDRWLKWHTMKQQEYQFTEGAVLLGHLVASTGEVFAVSRGADHKGYWLLQERGPSGSWGEEVAFDAGIVPLLIEGVTTRWFEVEPTADRREFGRAMRRSRKKLGMKVKKPVPPPFYVIRVDATKLVRLKQASPGAVSSGWTLDHRIEVAGHWRLRIHRGVGDVEASLEKKLKGRKYVFYREGQIEPELEHMLSRRGLRMPVGDEWIAVRRTWVDKHERGPESAPLIPAVRVT